MNLMQLPDEYQNDLQGRDGRCYYHEVLLFQAQAQGKEEWKKEWKKNKNLRLQTSLNNSSNNNPKEDWDIMLRLV